MIGSKEAATAAIRMATTASREEEKAVREYYQKMNIKTAAIDYGGEFSGAIPKIVERAVVAAQREGLIDDSHAQEGAVAGAAHEAVSQVFTKALGLNLGGKISISCTENHVAVCVFFAVGLLNLNDIVIGLGHRAI